MYYTITLASPTVEPNRNVLLDIYYKASIATNSCKIFLVRQFAIRNINIAAPCNAHNEVHLPRSPIHSFVSDQMPNIRYSYCNDYISRLFDNSRSEAKVAYNNISGEEQLFAIICLT